MAGVKVGWLSERDLVLCASRFCQQHGIVIDITPMRPAVELVSHVRAGTLEQAEVEAWLRANVQEGSADATLLTTTGPRPLEPFGTVCGHVVRGSADTALKASLAFATALDLELTRYGGRLYRPQPRAKNGHAIPGEVDGADEIHKAAELRIHKSDVYVIESSQLAGGAGLEADRARRLGLTVLIIADPDIDLSSSYEERPGVVILRVASRDAAARASAVVQWHLANRWRILQSARRRRDRALLHAARVSALNTAWHALSDEAKDDCAEECDLTRADIERVVTCTTAAATLFVEEMDRLTAALDIAPAVRRLAARVFTESELESLARVAKRRRLPADVALAAAMELLVLLEAPGQLRTERIDDELWEAYLDEWCS